MQTVCLNLIACALGQSRGTHSYTLEKIAISQRIWVLAKVPSTSLLHLGAHTHTHTHPQDPSTSLAAISDPTNLGTPAPPSGTFTSLIYQTRGPGWSTPSLQMKWRQLPNQDEPGNDRKRNLTRRESIAVPRGASRCDAVLERKLPRRGNV